MSETFVIDVNGARLAVGGRDEEEVQGAARHLESGLDQHLEVAAPDRGPAVHQTDSSRLEALGLQQQRSVHKFSLALSSKGSATFHEGGVFCSEH